VVKLKGGDRVPADLRIIQTSGLKVECSSLTGEPDAFEVTVAATHQEPHETRNLAFNSSQCTEGAAYGVVVRVADRTLIGMVAALASDTSTTVSTLQREVTRVVFFITGLAFVMGIVILIIGLCQKFRAVVVINLVITIFVANIPQGLPATVTSCLGIAAKRMYRRNVLVKNLEVIETLGATTCIASDKTGTLTQNRMSVQNFWFNGAFEMLHGQVVVARPSQLKAPDGLTASGKALDQLVRTTSGNSVASESQRPFAQWKMNPLEPLLLIAALCNSAKFAAPEGEQAGGASSRLSGKTTGIQAIPEGAAAAKVPGPAAGVATYLQGAKKAARNILGDASETALLRYCDAVYPVEMLRNMYRKAYDVPFNSTNKYALCIVDALPNEEPGKQYVLLKGAPEVVLARCTRWHGFGVEKPLDDEFQRLFQTAYERFANGGQRVLGFARQLIDKIPADRMGPDTVPVQHFVFMGLISLMDPPKVGVDDAVLDCHRAGIKVYMVTGDHALTAEAIARQIHIITLKTRADVAHERNVTIGDVDARDPEILAVVVTGSEMNTYTEDTWTWLFAHEQIVFARTTPQQKLEIVERLQRRGEVVAVTGDGVNDSPALKKANIGVAMGNPNASDVAREAADIVILDDDFCSIVAAIREGRLLFDNLKKSIAYTLTHLVPEIVPVALNIILVLPLALSSLLILTIDLGSELVPAISLAYEEPETAIMQRPPRNIKTDRLITKAMVLYSYVTVGLMESLAGVMSFLWVLWYNGIILEDIVLPSQNLWTAESDPFSSGGHVYSADEQVDILSKCNAALYANIILCQMFHLWFCRTRTTSVTQHALFSNRLAWVGMVWELMFILVFCYARGVDKVFVSGTGLKFQFWCTSLGFLVFIALYTETVKFSSRRALARGRHTLLSRLAW